jgi:hypothetical protein
MFNEFTFRSMSIDTSELYDFSTVQKPTIKILLYTDVPTRVVKEAVGFFGLGRMIVQLKAHAPAFANLDIRWEGRYSRGSDRADNKINVALNREVEKTGSPFDQIWVFGVHQVNRAKLNLRLNGGGPESELDADEVTALRCFMDNGGGVLVTGDHANPRPKDAVSPDPNSDCPDRFVKEPHLGLGRALGRCIPRAGLLRDWEGSPTSREDDSNDTQVVVFGLRSGNFDDEIIFEGDLIPQQLILQNFDENGSPSLRGQPHPLFFYRPGLSIKLFPDHLHEGQVTIPKELDDKDWPSNADGFRPEPRVVAFGLDKRSGRRFQLLAAYDGDGAGVGRIVADSTWHHYFNVNLTGFTLRANEGSASDQIGQFYGNLAVWLSPATKRLEMTNAMLEWLGQEPLVLENLGSIPSGNMSDKFRAGQTAHQLLASVASRCEIHEILQMAIPETYRYLDPSGAISLPDTGNTFSSLPSKDLMLGCLLNQHPPELLKELETMPAHIRSEKIRSVLTAGSVEAFDAHEQKLSETASFLQKFLTEARLKSSSISTKKSKE